VSGLVHLLSQISANAPYLYVCSCVYLVARAASACMRVAAAVIAMTARDKRSRAERALDVLLVTQPRRRRSAGAGRVGAP
jgi:hypothetical protein